MHSITIPVHSFVDVITNSSSEVFVTCNGKTIEVVKSIIKLFLENANIASPVDDLFVVELVFDNRDEDDEDYVCTDPDGGGYEDGPTSLRVRLKDPNNPNFGELVKLLNELNQCFSGEEYAN
jgi:hypothetical protein